MNNSTFLNSEKSITSILSLKGYLFVKRFFDIIFSFIATIFLIIIGLIIKIIYLFNKDSSSIFYTQERVGKDGKVFKLYKFRSMVPNADEVLKEMLKKKKYKHQWEKYQKFEDDPRITKLGGIFKKNITR